MQENSPRILIISNNCLSTTGNNGKTLYNLLKNFPSEKISQLFFSSEQPTIKIKSYYRITDYEVLKKPLMGKGLLGSEVDETVDEEKKQNDEPIEQKRITPTYFKRLLRGCMWQLKASVTPELDAWLEKCKPEVVFFLAGDFEFAYKITEYITKKYSARLITYITDDYFMPRLSASPSFWIRRNILKKKMKRVIALTSEFFTISPIMSEIYAELFGKRSKLLINLDVVSSGISEKSLEGKIELVYAGSLYYGREKTIQLLSNAIKNYNERHEKKADLNIYTMSNLTDKQKEGIENEFVHLRNPLGREELKSVYESAHYLIFVESFSKYDADKVRYAFSTKIPEYLVSGCNIIALGRSDINSIDFLKNSALCITDKTTLETKIEDYFNHMDTDYMENVNKCHKQYDLLLENVVQESEFKNIILNLNSDPASDIDG